MSPLSHGSAVGSLLHRNRAPSLFHLRNSSIRLHSTPATPSLHLTKPLAQRPQLNVKVSDTSTRTLAQRPKLNVQVSDNSTRSLIQRPKPIMKFSDQSSTPTQPWIRSTTLAARQSKLLKSSKAAPPPRTQTKNVNKWLGPLMQPPRDYFQTLDEYEKYLFFKTDNRKSQAMKIWTSTIPQLQALRQVITPQRVVVAILKGDLAPNSKRQYLSAVREQLPPDQFITQTQWKKVERECIQHAKLRRAEDQEAGKAPSITPKIMMDDILKGCRPSTLTYHSILDPNFLKIVAFRCYVTAHRWGDINGQWYIFHPRSQLVEVRQIEEKAVKREWSVFVPCNQEQYNRVWQRVQFPREEADRYRSFFFKFLKDNTQSMQCHSFRNGAIKMAHRELGIPSKKIELLLTNHGKVNSATDNYALTDPSTPEAKEQLVITTFLVRTLFPLLDY